MTTQNISSDNLSIRLIRGLGIQDPKNFCDLLVKLSGASLFYLLIFSVFASLAAMVLFAGYKAVTNIGSTLHTLLLFGTMAATIISCLAALFSVFAALPAIIGFYIKPIWLKVSETSLFKSICREILVDGIERYGPPQSLDAKIQHCKYRWKTYFNLETRDFINNASWISLGLYLFSTPAWQLLESGILPIELKNEVPMGFYTVPAVILAVSLLLRFISVKIIRSTS